MKKSNVFLSIGCLLLLGAALFVILALNHPEMSFPWRNDVTYIIYSIYVVAIIAMFALWIKTKK